MVSSFTSEQALALSRTSHKVHVVYLGSTPRRSLLACSLRHIKDRRIIHPVKPQLSHADAAELAVVIASLVVRGTGLPLVFTEHKGDTDEYWRTDYGKAGCIDV